MQNKAKGLIGVKGDNGEKSPSLSSSFFCSIYYYIKSYFLINNNNTPLKSKFTCKILKNFVIKTIELFNNAIIVIFKMDYRQESEAFQTICINKKIFQKYCNQFYYWTLQSFNENLPESYCSCLSSINSEFLKLFFSVSRSSETRLKSLSKDLFKAYKKLIKNICTTEDNFVSTITEYFNSYHSDVRTYLQEF